VERFLDSKMDFLAIENYLIIKMKKWNFYKL
jgi:hypothetical protein